MSLIEDPNRAWYLATWWGFAGFYLLVQIPEWVLLWLIWRRVRHGG